MSGWSKDELRVGSEAHYEDASLYDKTYARRTHDVAFYVNFAGARKPRVRSVLELGAGSGRVSIALAKKGISVTAVDAMPTMLTRLREQKKNLPPIVAERLRVVRGDLFKFRDGELYDLVLFPFNVLMHCYEREQLEKALATAAAHLRPRGSIVFDVLMPDMRSFFRDESRPYRAADVVHPVSKERFAYRERFAFDVVSQTQLITSEYENLRTGVRSILPLAHRQFFPAELEALLHYNGWRIENRFGDFEGGPLALDCETQIVVAKRR